MASTNVASVPVSKPADFPPDQRTLDTVGSTTGEEKREATTMAEQLDDVDWDRQRSVPTHPRAYPWSDWLNGHPWRIRQEEDYRCTSSSMVTQLQRRAREEGLKVRLRVDRRPNDPDHNDAIVFQFLKSSDS
jgi:hypothetical protein